MYPPVRVNVKVPIGAFEKGAATPCSLLAEAYARTASGVRAASTIAPRSAGVSHTTKGTARFRADSGTGSSRAVRSPDELGVSAGPRRPISDTPEPKATETGVDTTMTLLRRGGRR